MFKTDIKKIDFIKNIFIGLSTSLVNPSSHTKCVSLSNQKCMTQTTLINSNEYSQELRYCPFVVNLDSCDGSSNNLSDLPNKVLFQTKHDLNISVLT